MSLVPVQLDKERHLRLTLNSMIEFEELTGKSIMQGFTEISMKEMRTLLWLGLKWEDAELTEEMLGDLVDLSNVTEVAGAIRQALPGNPTKGPAN